MLFPAPAPVPDADWPAQAAVGGVAQRWVGWMENGRQVRASLARGGPPAPELTREHRSLEVGRTPLEERRRGEDGGPMEPPSGEPHG